MKRLPDSVGNWGFLGRAMWFLPLLGQLLVSTAGAQPNIVVVMTDDLGVRQFDHLLREGRLPNIQQHLIDAGVEFNNSFVTNSACCPSRVTFLRGQYSHNHRVFSNHTPVPGMAGIGWPGWFPKNGVPGRNESTLATWLQDAGYHTGYVGKYLNGYGSLAPDGVADPRTYIPPGWSEWFGSVGLSTYRVYNVLMNQNGVLVQYGNSEADYQTDIYSGLAVDFIQRAAQAPEPFFLFVATLAPHLEVPEVATGLLLGSNPLAGLQNIIRPPPRYEHLIDGDDTNDEMTLLPHQPSFNEADISDKPSCPRPVPPAGITYVTEPVCLGDAPLYRDDPDIANVEFQNKAMMASMLAVDDMVGAVVNQLSSAGVLDNTVIVFLSDNGWMSGEHRTVGKDLAYEESIRVPLVIRAPFTAVNGKSEHIVLNNDMAPTIADLAGTTAPYNMDGASLVPILSDPVNAPWHRHMFLYEHFFVPSVFKFEAATQFALRRKYNGQDYTYIATHADKENPSQATDHEFYNLQADPYQMESLTLPESATSLIDNLLRNFLRCGGAGCRDFEGR